MCVICQNHPVWMVYHNGKHWGSYWYDKTAESVAAHGIRELGGFWVFGLGVVSEYHNS